ncbi:MAG: repeat-containing protein [Pedosphaera sp.]|nr:repeat-containing protein [Pedosphaera sp.]
MLIVAVVGGVAWFALRHHQPFYNGKGLRSWLETVHMKGMIVPGSEEETAIRAIGTNALPELLRMISAKNNTTVWSNMLSRMSLRTRFRYHLLSADDVRWDGNGGFLVLGAAAKPAVPALIDLLEHDKNIDVRRHAAIALQRIGPGAVEAIPNFIQHANDPDNVVGCVVLGALGDVQARPEVVIPFLIGNLTTSQADSSLFRANTTALAKYGKDAQAAVPVLLRFVNGADEAARKNALNWQYIEAAKALKAIDPEAAAKAGVK